MTKHDEIRALREEIAELRKAVQALTAQAGAVHHHHHYAPAPVPISTPWSPMVTPYTMPSPNICRSGGSQLSVDLGKVTTWNRGI